MKKILITGGCGFIGSNFIRYIFTQKDFNGIIINVDKLTYAGNLENLEDVFEKYNEKRYFFEKIDICVFKGIDDVFMRYHPDCIINFAAESHVDRSIYGPKAFIETNILGTYNLLEVAKKFWRESQDVLFHHVSTDEVYGSLGATGSFSENTPYDPHNPYSASKASSDHLVKAYFHTYAIPITISNCSNNYGPYQFPEKLIPLMINNMLEEKPLPIYGDGMNIRDWLYVEDHCNAIWKIINNGKRGETYNIGGENEWTNIQLINLLGEIVSRKMNKSRDFFKKLIEFVMDRPGHDRRYAIDCSKIKNELKWTQTVNFALGLEKTVNWYVSNQEWIENVKSGKYRDWINKNYHTR